MVIGSLLLVDADNDFFFTKEDDFFGENASFAGFQEKMDTLATVETDLVFSEILTNDVAVLFLRELAVVGIVALEVFLEDLGGIVGGRGRVVCASFGVLVIVVVLGVGGGLFLVIFEFDQIHAFIQNSENIELFDFLRDVFENVVILDDFLALLLLEVLLLLLLLLLHVVEIVLGLLLVITDVSVVVVVLTEVVSLLVHFGKLVVF